MAAKYFIRLDDAHERMCIENWQKVEQLLCKHDVQPIVAVIPRNQDKSICHVSDRCNLWEVVTRWKGMGWHIGMHGYQHILRESDYGMFPINKYSEFVGLAYDDQAKMIKKSLDIFSDNGLYPSIFIAPAHGMDSTTLKALKNVTDIRIISDGFYLFPKRRKAFTIFPQQLWTFRTMPFGIWTFCLHPDSMSNRDFDRLDKFLSSNSEFFPKSLVKAKSYSSIPNFIFNILYSFIYRLKHCLK